MFYCAGLQREGKENVAVALKGLQAGASANRLAERNAQTVNSDLAIASALT